MGTILGTFPVQFRPRLVEPVKLIPAFVSVYKHMYSAVCSQEFVALAAVLVKIKSSAI